MTKTSALQPLVSWLPAEAVEQHVGIIAKTGKGKTYAAKTLVEQLLKAGRVVGIVDPMDVYWGLRLDKDGTTPVNPKLVILGGKHGDMPLPPLSGAAVAELLCVQRVSLVAVTKHMSVKDRTRWFTDFAEALLRLNTRPVHLVLDEVHNFAPQGKVHSPDAGVMLHAANALFSEGRSAGFRIIGISQRPAKWHKDALTCVDTLVALGMVAPQDRDAAKDWIDGCGDAKKGREVLDSLAGLKKGTGWVWFPEGDYLRKIDFPRIETFDSSATPTHDAAEEPERELGSVDLTAVEAALAAATKEAEENDVKLLRAQVTELRAKLAKAMTPAAIAQPANIDRQIAAAVEACGRHTAMQVSGLEKRLEAAIDRADAAVGELNEISVALAGLASNLTASPSTTASVTPAPAARNGTVHHQGGLVAGRVDGLTGPQRKLIDAAAWWAALGITDPTRTQVAVVAGYTVSGGTWRTLLSECRTLQLVECEADAIMLTSAGFASAKHPDAVPTQDELHARVREVLSNPQLKLFDVLVVHSRGAEIARTQAAELAGYEAAGGTFRTLVSELSSLGLCRYPKRTTVQASAWLFPGEAKS